LSQASLEDSPHPLGAEGRSPPKSRDQQKYGLITDSKIEGIDSVLG
jgi:hypothetical protein